VSAQQPPECRLWAWEVAALGVPGGVVAGMVAGPESRESLLGSGTRDRRFAAHTATKDTATTVYPVAPNIQQ
jgi:hypothetical protein